MIVGKSRRGRIVKQLLDDLTEKRRSWNLKAEGVDRTVWRNGFGRGDGPVEKRTRK
jgi:hypothetical protein